MEKILLVVDAHSPNLTSIDFACQMAKASESKLTGLFIENLFEHRLSALPAETYFQSGSTNSGNTLVVMDTAHASKVFMEQCALHNIKANTYLDKGEPIQEVIYESRFADLLVIYPKMNFYHIADQLPSHFVKEILANAECPVLLSPDVYTEVEEVVFCYDGSSSAVHAQKQFTHLFPQFKNKKAVLLEVNKSSKDQFNEDHRRLMEWMRAHYQNIVYQALQGDAKEELFEYFFMKQNKIIVMGAYGRNLFSAFFKRSTADIVMRTIDLPLFIAHE